MSTAALSMKTAPQHIVKSIHVVHANAVNIIVSPIVISAACITISWSDILAQRYPMATDSHNTNVSNNI